MAGYISKGITLGYSTASTPSTYTNLTGLQRIGDLGGNADSIEITTLADAAHVYMNGLLAYGDSIEFVFLHNASTFAEMAALTGEVSWKVSLPDGVDGAIDTVATFKGYPSVRINGVGTNEALTDTLSIKPSTAITFA